MNPCKSVLLFTVFFAFTWDTVSAQLVQITKDKYTTIHLHWFPDNKRLISTGTGEEGSGMYIVSTTDGSVKHLDIGPNFTGDFYTAVSPDSRWVLFDARRGKSSINIWKVSVNGGIPEQMTEDGGWMPCWSPDGKQFAYVYQGDIYIKDLQTGTNRKVIDAGRADFHPWWSPDGKNIAFNPQIDDNYEICFSPVSGDNFVNISNHPGKDLYPCWAPDGSMILFNSERSGNQDLWVYDVERKSLKQITTDPAKDVCATWSPDGSKIAFTSFRDGNPNIWILETKEFYKSNEISLLQAPYLGQKPPGKIPVVFAPAWISTEENFEFAGTFTPDLQEFFFTRRKNGTIDNRIYHVRFENGRFTRPALAPFAYDCFEFEPHISPDGRLLFYGTRRPIQENDSLAKGTNVWLVKKTPNGWSEPHYPGPPFDEAMFVCMAEDATMYNSGLTRSVPLEGKYGPWEKLAPHLYGPFMHPCIGPHEAYIIFDTDHSLDGQGKSLLISFRQPDGSWGEIISFRKLAPFRDMEKFGMPMLTPDKEYLFFSYQGDLYWVHAAIIDDLRHKYVTDSVE